ncbi:transforming acidic coiled-coil-containing protein 2 isoform X3 [Patella vulgata]|uniref:transforming acidic coiled-coil-containing protein 2 isoform X3 n=1 Tax=Patella vulgata TaxID=6465 RepID=UPI0024A843B8|nr:transforming acidic coiled-coil-containing protein 2 isoform X3 [Patella vulgata]
MADQDQSSPIPIAKGTYDFDFDNLDEVNPFQSKTKLGNSPPLNGNNNNDEISVGVTDKFSDVSDDIDPFKSRNRLSSSPPVKLVNNNEGEIDGHKLLEEELGNLNINDNILDIPYGEEPEKVSPKKASPKKSAQKSKSSVTASPGSKPEKDDTERLIQSPSKSENLAEPESPKAQDDIVNMERKLESPMSKTLDSDQCREENVNGVKSSPESKTQKKTPTPKKGIKKPKSAVKKTPKKFVDLDDEIQIFAPESPAQQNDKGPDLEDDNMQIFAPPPPQHVENGSKQINNTDLADIDGRNKVNELDTGDDIQIFAPSPPEHGENSPVQAKKPDMTLDGEALNINKLDRDNQIFASPPPFVDSPQPDQADSAKASEPNVNNCHGEEVDGNTSGDDDITFHDAQQDISEVPSGMTASADLRLAHQMAGSLDAVHEFGAGEDAEMSEDNEGFVPATDAFSDSANWEMLEKIGVGDSKCALTLGRESLYVAFDPYVQPIRPAAEVIPEKEEETTPPRFATNSSLSSEKDLLQLNTPSPSSVKQKSKNHPAARKLQDQFEAKSVPPNQDVDRLLFSTSPIVSTDTKSLASDNLHFIEGSDIQDAWVDQIHNYTEIEDSSRLSQDSVDNYSCLNDNQELCEDGTEFDHGEDRNMAGHDQVVQLVQVMKYSQSEWNKMKQELELSFQSELLNKEKEWSKKLADRDKKLAHMEEKHRKAQQTNEDMRAVVAEFEKTIAQLQAERQKSCLNSQQSLQDIMKERDQALEDLNSVETAFSDLHRRFEKAKGVVETFKKNEEALKKCVEEYQEKDKKSKAKLQALKQQAEEKLEQAHHDIEKVKKSTYTDIAKLEAALKKSEIQIKGLEHSLEQKKRENEELTNICDELISKVGQN